LLDSHTFDFELIEQKQICSQWNKQLVEAQFDPMTAPPVSRRTTLSLCLRRSRLSPSRQLRRSHWCLSRRNLLEARPCLSLSTLKWLLRRSLLRSSATLSRGWEFCFIGTQEAHGVSA
jgi:hypothetical protein